LRNSIWPHVSLLLCCALITIVVGMRAGDADVGAPACLTAEGNAADQAFSVAREMNHRRITTCATATIQESMDSSEFIDQLFSEVSPQTVADSITGMASQNCELASDQSMLPKVVCPPERQTLYRDYLTALGAAVARHSQQISVKGGTSALTQQWAESIIDPERPGNAAGLTLLVAQGGTEAEYDSQFLAGVADRLYDEELQQPDIWLERVEAGAAVTFPPDAPIQAAAWESARPAYDAMANVLQAMAKTPEAAEDFFDDGELVRVGEVNVNEKLHHLLVERQWSDDQAIGLGVALQGATTHFRDEVMLEGGAKQVWKPAEATLMAQFIYLTGNMASRESVPTGWHLPSGMGEPAGIMLLHYYESFRQVESYRPGEDNWLSSWSGDLLVNRGYYKIFLDEATRAGGNAVEYLWAAALIDLRSSFLDLAVASLQGGAPTLVNGQRAEKSLMKDVEVECAYKGAALSVIVDSYDYGNNEPTMTEDLKRLLAWASQAAWDVMPTGGGDGGNLLSFSFSALRTALDEVPISDIDVWMQNDQMLIRAALAQTMQDALIRSGLAPIAAPGTYVVPGQGLPHEAVKWLDGKPQGLKNIYRNLPWNTAALIGEDERTRTSVANYFRGTGATEFIGYGVGNVSLRLPDFVKTR
jgi:hypothetical protein